MAIFAPLAALAIIFLFVGFTLVRGYAFAIKDWVSTGIEEGYSKASIALSTLFIFGTPFVLAWHGWNRDWKPGWEEYAVVAIACFGVLLGPLILFRIIVSGPAAAAAEEGAGRAGQAAAGAYLPLTIIACVIQAYLGGWEVNWVDCLWTAAGTAAALTALVTVTPVLALLPSDLAEGLSQRPPASGSERERRAMRFRAIHWLCLIAFGAYGLIAGWPTWTPGAIAGLAASAFLLSAAEGLREDGAIVVCVLSVLATTGIYLTEAAINGWPEFGPWAASAALAAWCAAAWALHGAPGSGPWAMRAWWGALLGFVAWTLAAGWPEVMPVWLAILAACAIFLSALAIYGPEREAAAGHFFGTLAVIAGAWVANGFLNGWPSAAGWHIGGWIGAIVLFGLMHDRWEQASGGA